MAIWVIKDGQREGPYQEQDVRELVYEGTYTDADPAIRDGQFDWGTVGQVLGRQASPAEPAAPPAAEPPPLPTPTDLLPEFPLEPPPYSAAMPASAAAPEEPAPIPVTAVAPTPEPGRPVQVAVVDFEMPFGSMVVLMVKWALAAIPALVILGAFAAIFWVGFFALISAVLHH